ncbi:NUDIX hydrolase [Candidatus Gracilibacteria bacterium CG17_big_fil_post_rev_8_21_14_2_50_48_13]|nr:MAG: NUDIX hydrolase [Candidatus Gracilibacteria bacterium CG17_big_fil_post_rev_8_21_14_2_50_48_13]
MDLPSCFYRVSVKALILDVQGRFLLSREDNGGWDLLGGGLDHDEDPHTGLRREVMEETGLTLMDIGDAPVYFVTTRNEHNTPFCNVIYRASLKNLDFVPSKECVELRYFTAEEALEVRLFPNVMQFLKVFQG